MNFVSIFPFLLLGLFIISCMIIFYCIYYSIARRCCYLYTQRKKKKKIYHVYVSFFTFPYFNFLSVIIVSRASRITFHFVSYPFILILIKHSYHYQFHRVFFLVSILLHAFFEEKRKNRMYNE